MGPVPGFKNVLLGILGRDIASSVPLPWLHLLTCCRYWTQVQLHQCDGEIGGSLLTGPAVRELNGKVAAAASILMMMMPLHRIVYRWFDSARRRSFSRSCLKLMRPTLRSPRIRQDCLTADQRDPSHTAHDTRLANGYTLVMRRYLVFVCLIRYSDQKV